MRRYLYAIVSIVVVLGFWFSPAAAQAAQPADELSILFTHDLHSHFLPFKELGKKDPKAVGGYARMQTLINQKRQQVDPLLVDAGDFSMGTLFQTIFTNHASELALLGEMGFDATTLGNHEFDYGTQSLADMLHSAARQADGPEKQKLPQMLFSPNDFEYKKYESTSTPLEDLSDAFASIGTKRTMVIEKNGIKIGLFSAFGQASIDFAPFMELDIPSLEDNARESIAELRKQDVDIIVCLSHSGTSPDPKKSEDELLAKAVPKIDIIVSGHTHTFLYEPIVIGDTTIVSNGEYGQYLGDLTLQRNGDRWKAKEYELVAVDETIIEDPAIAQRIAAYQDIVTKEYLSQLGDSDFSQVLATTNYPNLAFDVYERHGENSMGSLISDAFAHAVQSIESSSAASEPLIAIEPAGVIRWGIAQGDVTLSNVFDVASLGNGPDELAGYPLIDVYLTGAELKNVAEVDASVSGIMPEAQLYSSGMGWELNPNRLIFNKTTDVWLTDKEGSRTSVEPDKLYRVVVNSYSAEMLGSVKDKSFGLLSIVPKDENGVEITDFNTRILRDKNGAEIKEWAAIATYLSSFDKNEEGTPQIPAYYTQDHGRKVIDESLNFSTYFAHLNAIALGLYAIILVLVLIVVGIVILVVRRRKKKKALAAAA